MGVLRQAGGALAFFFRFTPGNDFAFARIDFTLCFGLATRDMLTLLRLGFAPRLGLTQGGQFALRLRCPLFGLLALLFRQTPRGGLALARLHFPLGVGGAPFRL